MYKNIIKNKLSALLITALFFVVPLAAGGCGGGGDSAALGENHVVALRVSCGLPVSGAAAEFYDARGRLISSVSFAADRDGVGYLLAPLPEGRPVRCLIRLCSFPQTPGMEGTLSSYVASYRRGELITVNILTTVADRLRAAYGMESGEADGAARALLSLPRDLDIRMADEMSLGAYFDSTEFLRDAAAFGSFDGFVAGIVDKRRTGGAAVDYSLPSGLGGRSVTSLSAMSVNSFYVSRIADGMADKIKEMEQFFTELSKGEEALLAVMESFPLAMITYKNDRASINELDLGVAENIEAANYNALRLMESMEQQAAALSAYRQELEMFKEYKAYKERADEVVEIERAFKRQYENMTEGSKDSLKELEDILTKAQGQEVEAVSGDLSDFARRMHTQYCNFVNDVLSAKGSDFEGKLDEYMLKAPALLEALRDLLVTARSQGRVSDVSAQNIMAAEYAQILKNMNYGLTVYMNCLYSRTLQEFLKQSDKENWDLDLSELEEQYAETAAKGAALNRSYLHGLYQILSCFGSENLYSNGAVMMLDAAIDAVEVNEWLASSDKKLHGGLKVWSYERLSFPYVNGIVIATGSGKLPQVSDVNGTIAVPLGHELVQDSSFFAAILSADESDVAGRAGIGTASTVSGKVVLNRYLVSGGAEQTQDDSQIAWSGDVWQLGEWSLGGVLDTVVPVILKNICTGETEWRPGEVPSFTLSADRMLRPEGLTASFVDYSGEGIFASQRSVRHNMTNAAAEVRLSEIGGGLGTQAVSAFTLENGSSGDAVIVREWKLALLASPDKNEGEWSVDVSPDIWSFADRQLGSCSLTHKFELKVNDANAVCEKVWDSSQTRHYSPGPLSLRGGGSVDSISLTETIILKKGNRLDNKGVVRSVTRMPAFRLSVGER